MVASGVAHLSGPLVILSGSSMCLYNAVRFLGLPELYDAPTTAGPFSVSHYSENVRRYSQTCDIQKTPLYLALCEKSALVGSDAGSCKDYVCYSQPKSSPAAIGHFFAVSVEQGDEYVRVMDDSAQYAVRMRRSVFADDGGRRSDYVRICCDGGCARG